MLTTTYPRRIPLRTGLLVLTSAALGSVLLAAPAGAHPQASDPSASFGGAGDGLLHPLLGLDHLAAMVAIGAMAALATRVLPVWSVPAGFVGGMLAGAALGFAGAGVTGVEQAIAASVLILGVSILAARRVPLGSWLVPAAAVLGAMHGNAHGLEAPAAAAFGLSLLAG